MKKDTVYIDIEDDITAIIEKINDSSEKIVALVPPKRSTALSSVVNLKLIHKIAQDQNKRVVLITTDKTIVSLAGGIGMYVASNLQSAPAIPVVAAPPDELPSEVIRDDDPAPAKPAAKASAAVVGAAAAVSGEEVVDDLSKGDSKLKKVLKAPKVPDFNRFKKKVFLLIFGGIGLVALLVWAFYWAPRAHIVLAGQTNRLPTEVSFTADTALKEADFDKKLLPATSKEIKRESTESFTPSGEKDLGKKATGSASLKNCTDAVGTVTIPAGTRLTSETFTFLTNEPVVLPQSIFAGGSNNCLTSAQSVAVTAQKGGDAYNLSSRQYQVAGYGNVVATGSDMSGGTSELVKIVSQSDIDKAKEAALKKLRDGAKAELAKEFDVATYVLSESYGEDIGDFKPSVPVGERADSASLTASATFFILGVDRAVMEEFLRTEQQPKLQANQAIFKTGLAEVRLTKTGAKSAGRQTFTLKTDGFAGPDANIDQLRGELAGQSFGKAKSALEAIPGVSEAKIDLSPFWVFSMPRRTGNITITINVDQAELPQS